jgi:hypothetical protein
MLQTLNPTVKYGRYGTPLRWQYHNNEELSEAVFILTNYWSAPHKNPAPNSQEIALIRNYLIYFVNAPCWLLSNLEIAQFDALKIAVANIQTLEDINDWNYCVRSDSFCLRTSMILVLFWYWLKN